MMKYLVVVLSSVFVLFPSHVAFGQEAAGEVMTVRGTVVDFSGRPWKEAVIRIRSKELSGQPVTSTFQKQATSDGSGRYSFVRIPVGLYEIWLESATPALREIKEVPILADGSVFEVDFGLEIGSIGDCPRHFILGNVTDTKNGTIEGAKISVINTFNQRRVFSAKTDKSGKYIIAICNPGQYIVFVNTPLYQVRSETVIFMHKEGSKIVNFRLAPLK